MHDYDTTLKEVLPGSAQLTLYRLTGLDIRSWRNVELPQVAARRLDLLAETDANALVHFELQSTNDVTIALRMLGYGVDAWRLHNRFPSRSSFMSALRRCGWSTGWNCPRSLTISA